MPVAKKILTGIVGCTMLLWAVQVQAEGIFGGKTLGQRLDDLNRSIFGPADSSEEDTELPPVKPTVKKSTNENSSVLVPRESSQSRAGSIMEPGKGPKPVANSGTAKVERNNNVVRQADRRSSAGSAPANPYRPLLDTSLLDGEDSQSDASQNPTVSNGRSQPNATQSRVVTPDGKRTQPPQISEFGPPPSPSIQNRLMQSRTSAFKNSATESRPVATDAAPAESNVVEPADPSDATSVVEQPLPSRPAKVPGQPTPAKRPWESDHAGQPIIAQRTTPTVQRDGVGTTNVPHPVQPAHPSIASDNAVGAANPTPTLNPPANQNRPENPVPAVNKRGKDEELLVTRRGPVLSVETLVPRKNIVGRESPYEVVLQNSGEVAAEDVVVFVSLPDWAEIARADASAGVPQFQAPGQTDSPFQWKVARLDPKAKEKLSLKIIPRQNRPFDLAVRWEMRSAASQAAIEVQEPKLELQLEGARDVFFGKKETYRLKMKNTGTGNAEGVEVMLMPIGPGENAPATYRLGVLPAGEVKSIEIELTARQAGELNIQVEAKGEGGIRASLAEKVLVRRAALEVVVEGPKLQFVGSAATYLVHVKNPGNAPAVNLRMSAKLPAGMKYIAGIDGVQTDASGAKLQWSLDSLNPQLEKVYAVKCRLGALGATRFDVTATAEDELSTTGGTSTQVEAAASLSLDVQDPAGPISVGEESVYEVHIRNRGTKNAENVEVFVFLSKGFEPIAAEGGANRFGAGRVVFAPLNSLTPGGEAVFKIRAKADVAGNHIFRTEVHCKANEVRLVSEKNTFFYQDSQAQDSSAVMVPSEANRTNTPPETYRTQRR